MVNIEKLSQEGPEGPFLTNTDRLLRELNIIEVIFKAQFIKYNEIKEDPFILDQNGHDGIDGRYIASFDLYSDVELFNIQLYKDDYTKRYENSKHTTLLEAELLEVYAKAIRVRDYYNDNLTNDSKIRLDYLETQKLPIEQAAEKFREHCASIEIFRYNLMSIYFDGGGGKLIRFNKPLLHSFGWNSSLSQVCQSVINFIDKFNLNIPESFQTGNESPKNIIEIKELNNKVEKIRKGPQKFEDLFVNPLLVPDCIDLLKNLDKPCINDANEFLREKGFFVVWLSALEHKKMLNYTFTNDEERAETLNYNFPNLNIKPSTFRSNNTKARSYKSHFETEISAIKE